MQEPYQEKITAVFPLAHIVRAPWWRRLIAHVRAWRSRDARELEAAERRMLEVTDAAAGMIDRQRSEIADLRIENSRWRLEAGACKTQLRALGVRPPPSLYRVGALGDLYPADEKPRAGDGVRKTEPK